MSDGGGFLADRGTPQSPRKKNLRGPIWLAVKLNIIQKNGQIKLISTGGHEQGGNDSLKLVPDEQSCIFRANYIPK